MIPKERGKLIRAAQLRYCRKMRQIMRGVKCQKLRQK